MIADVHALHIKTEREGCLNGNGPSQHCLQTTARVLGH